MRWNIACWISLIALFLLAGCGDSTSVECTTDTDCEGTLVCRDGRCVPEPECETDADCLGKAPPICHLSENPQCVEGACQFAQAPAGTACEDGDLCTRDTSCDAAGQCGGGSPTCVAPDAECIGSVCREYSASCYELTGECSYPYTETDYESVDECHAHCGTCVPSCEGLPCGSGDGCGGTCEQGSGCICSCEGKICGEEDGCGNVCEEGSGCISPDCEVEGDLCFGNCRVCDENLQCTRDDDALCTGDCDFCFEGNCEPDDGMCDTEQCEFCRGSGTEFNCVSDLPTAPTVSASENPICAGGSTSLEVEADEEEDYEYEWFEGSCAGNPIHECHDMICDVSPEVTTSYYVRRIHPGCPQPSECASVTVQVDPASAGGAVSGGTTPINLGSDTGAMTLGGHVGAVVRWERRVDGGAWEPIDVQTTTYSDTPPATGTWDYRVQVRSGVCDPAYSATRAIVVEPAGAGGTVSGGTTPICLGESTGTMTLGGHVGAVVRWERRVDAGTWEHIANTSTTHSETPPSAGAWDYRALVQSGAEQVYSGTRTILVSPTSVGGAVSGGTTPICLGSSTGTMTLSGHTGAVVRWQRRVDSGTWENIANTTTSHSETPASAGTWDYRARVQSSPCAAVSSAIRTILVSPASVGGAVSGGNPSIDLGQSTGTLTLNGHTGAVLRWQRRVDGGTWEHIANTSTSHSETPPSAGTWDYRAVVQSSPCSAAYSTPRAIVVAYGLDDVILSFAHHGVYCRNSMSGQWKRMASSASQIAAGDLDGDGIDDLVGVWPEQGGVFVLPSSTGIWALLADTPDWIACGDMDGDGLDDLLTVDAEVGVSCRDSASGSWTSLASTATQIAAADLDADGTDDLIGVWPEQGGVWVRYSASAHWELLADMPDWIAAGEMSGDGVDDLVVSTLADGVLYRDSSNGTWEHLASPASMMAAGDLDGDDVDDLVGAWPEQGGVWFFGSNDDNWEYLTGTPAWIATGKGGLCSDAAGPNPVEVYWIAPNGSDARDCRTRANACGSWAGMLGKASADIGARPLELVFACGDYSKAANGPFFFERNQEIVLQGTSDAPIWIRGAETWDRPCATVQGDGGLVFRLKDPEWVTVSNLRFTQVDSCDFANTYCWNKSVGSIDSYGCQKQSDCNTGSYCFCPCPETIAVLDDIDGDYDGIITNCGVHTFFIDKGMHIEIRDNEMAGNNRYQNAMPMMVFDSRGYVRIENNRVYGSHRHLISYAFPQWKSSDYDPASWQPRAVISGNYANGCAGLSGPAYDHVLDCSAYGNDPHPFGATLTDGNVLGWGSHYKHGADECVSTYYADDVAVVNNVLEYCEHLGANIGYGGGDGNLYANNVINQYTMGLRSGANSGTAYGVRTEETTGEHNRYVNNALIGSIYFGSLFRDGHATEVRNNTLIRAALEGANGWLDPQPDWPHAIYVEWTHDTTDETCPCGAEDPDPPATLTSIAFERNFIAGHDDAAWDSAFHLSSVCEVSLTDNHYCASLTSGCGSGAIFVTDTYPWGDPPTYPCGVGADLPTVQAQNNGRCPGCALDIANSGPYVFIRDGDPRRTLAGGEPVGADIRCVVDDRGNPTRIPIWDPRAGLFGDDPLGVLGRLGVDPPPACP